ncbi:MAG: DUF599 domain-containing protein [Thermodesulfobacteriota bacterium]
MPPDDILLTAAAFLLLAAYHLHLYWVRRHSPAVTSFARNAQTRTTWVQNIMEHNRDILAVQTLRNWTMAASFLASTSILIALALLNVALTARLSPASLPGTSILGSHPEGLRLAKLLLLSADFFFAFFNFTLAIRYYNHVGFMINVPRGPQSLVDLTYVADTLNLAATHYTLGMRGYYLAIPLAFWLLGPGWLLAASSVLTAVLYKLDRTG